MKKMIKEARGFTLVELIIIIVIVGILAATAIPKYFDLTEEAANGAMKGVLGALRSQNSLMFAERVLKGTHGGYTMGDIVTGMQQISGVEYSVEDKDHLKVKVKSYEYNIKADPLPEVPGEPGKIFCKEYPEW